MIQETQIRKLLSPLELAASSWWRGKRPLEFDYAAHMACPAVNCTTMPDKVLGHAVSKEYERVLVLLKKWGA